MSNALSLLPLWELIVLVVLAPTAVAVGLQIVVRRWAGFERLEVNNELAGFLFGAIGVFYSVLLAFVVVAVWEKFSEGQTSVARESAAASALFHYAEGAEPQAIALRDRVVDYLKLTIEKDWRAMAAESADLETSQALDAVYRAAMALNRTGTRSAPDMTAVFTQVDNLNLARRVRLHLSTGLLPDVIWLVLFAGAGLTIYFTLFFGSRNAAAQLAMTAILSIVLTSGLVIIISLDHPFSGPVHIEPESLEQVLAAETGH
ncbi:uncharacterized protein DUF4239 [Roseiarcus fermentans]|uniref:Uncharacterized protein DUF4239 n=1 Tax=Roseiarcus fermentans TaxID=1473586 RepID=A0A366FP12_9HYPH|nr:DUF4239 domain-containing protein [Roseiarcus fermentans]RBP16444.1 uncharacterized protein DUF4239 [Roseiarcus fermentans]